MGDAVRVLAVAQAPVLGGAELALLRLARLLPARGFEVAAAVPGPGPLADALAAANVHAAGRIPVTRIMLGGVGRGQWPAAVAGWPLTRAAARRFRPQLVWLNGVVTLRAAPALGRSTPLVPYLHDLLEMTPRVWRSRRFWARTPLVLCASEAVARAAAAVGAPEERLRVVWAPVERPEPAPQPSWAGDGPVVGYVGRIEPRKGTLDLLEAFPALLEQRPDARLVMAGDAELDVPREYRAAVERATARLGDRVSVLGRVERASALMPWFDVLAVPSLEEPFGTVAAEALAAGTPVVATSAGGIGEYVRAGVDGEIVAPADPAALASALATVLARGRIAARNEFSADRIADLVAGAFREALG